MGTTGLVDAARRAPAAVRVALPVSLPPYPFPGSSLAASRPR